MVPIQGKQLITTTKVPLEVGKEEVQMPSAQVPSAQVPSAQVPSAQVPSAQLPSPRTQLPPPLRGACNNCLKPISKNFNTSTSATNASINNKQLQKQHNSHNNKFTIKHLIIFTKQHNNDILLMEIEYGKE
mgnify:CR=1 FL=1